MVEVCDNLDSSLQWDSNVGMVLSNGKVGWDCDAQPEVRSPLCNSLCLKLAKPITWSKHRYKCQWHTIGAGNLCRELYSQDESIPSAEESIHANNVQSFTVVVFSRLLAGELDLTDLDVLRSAGVDTQRGGGTQWRRARWMCGGRPAAGPWGRCRAVEARGRSAVGSE